MFIEQLHFRRYKKCSSHSSFKNIHSIKGVKGKLMFMTIMFQYFDTCLCEILR